MIIFRSRPYLLDSDTFAEHSFHYGFHGNLHATRVHVHVILWKDLRWINRFMERSRMRNISRKSRSDPSLRRAPRWSLIEWSVCACLSIDERFVSRVPNKMLRSLWCRSNSFDTQYSDSSFSQFNFSTQRQNLVAFALGKKRWKERWIIVKKW